MKKITSIKPKYLLLLASIVWIIAGGNILKIGIPDFIDYWHYNILYLLGTISIFLIFMIKIFYQLVKKHYGRITKIKNEKVPFYYFFDRKSYLVMIFMITVGILLRSTHILPNIIIGILYCGIGMSLLGAGILFLQKFIVVKNTTFNT